MNLSCECLLKENGPLIPIPVYVFYVITKKLLKNKHVTTYQPNFEIFRLRTKPEMLQRWNEAITFFDFLEDKCFKDFSYFLMCH